MNDPVSTAQADEVGVVRSSCANRVFRSTGSPPPASPDANDLARAPLLDDRLGSGICMAVVSLGLVTDPDAWLCLSMAHGRIGTRQAVPHVQRCFAGLVRRALPVERRLFTRYRGRRGRIRDHDHARPRPPDRTRRLEQEDASPSGPELLTAAEWQVSRAICQ
jgi:hypothetical protein